MMYYYVKISGINILAMTSYMSPWVMNFANSMVGVGVLAMPFVFEKVCFDSTRIRLSGCKYKKVQIVVHNMSSVFSRCFMYEIM